MAIATKFTQIVAGTPDRFVVVSVFSGAAAGRPDCRASPALGPFRIRYRPTAGLSLRRRRGDSATVDDVVAGEAVTQPEALPTCLARVSA